MSKRTDTAAVGEAPNAQRRVEVGLADLPLHCPLPGKRLWDSHPKVYIPLGQRSLDQDLSQAGASVAGDTQTCPYCGTTYVLVIGDR